MWRGAVCRGGDSNEIRVSVLLEQSSYPCFPLWGSGGNEAANQGLSSIGG